MGTERAHLSPQRVQRLRLRADLLREIRAFFDRQEFLEVETPLVVPSLPQRVARVRRYAVDACHAHGWAGDCDTVALLVSEVATNALVHGTGDVRLVSTAPARGCGSTSPTPAPRLRSAAGRSTCCRAWSGS
ncbi:MAG: hypothetical protein KY463_11630 [Actinobacteria bacterium]|nr:hypothetical protein [Actinomycetota bacterium]